MRFIFNIHLRSYDPNLICLSVKFCCVIYSNNNGHYYYYFYPYFNTFILKLFYRQMVVGVSPALKDVEVICFDMDLQGHEILIVKAPQSSVYVRI